MFATQVKWVNWLIVDSQSALFLALFDPLGLKFYMKLLTYDYIRN